MAGDSALLVLLARALTYPDAAAPALVAECSAAGGWAEPAAAAALGRFAEALAGDTVETMQERFTQTFDFDPKCTLDIGWHLFGENYERGDFLVRMRVALAAHGIEEGVDLPDHLPNALRLLARMAPDRAAELASVSVVPAVEKILAGLDGRDSPYEQIVRSVHAAASGLAHATAGEVPHG
ncbi:MAG TPA: nitrate reductase molybdenum cofactor assembly chaperone [Vicinamibacterales bacterium]|nr:nitrate reductase molybdenum cofactor assembly chaperone [Vicinamibacterales bacterium]